MDDEEKQKEAKKLLIRAGYSEREIVEIIDRTPFAPSKKDG